VIDGPARLRLAVPDVPAALALAHQWAGGAAPVLVGQTLALESAEAALRAGATDVAFVPTLAVLRDPDAFTVVPGVALVGRAYPAAQLFLPAGLAPLAPGRPVRIGLDPRFMQEALLAQVVVKEVYGAAPQFVPVPPEGPPPAGLDAYLMAPGAPAGTEGVTLDLGQEWFEMTTRPMVWALLATVAGGVEPDEARFLRDRAAEFAGEEEAPGVEEPTSVTLGAYAHAGLDEWVHQLYYHRALDDMPEVPFMVLSGGEEEDEDADDE
jgi:hypothetical protein